MKGQQTEYKANIIREHLENMRKDEHYLAQLTTSGCVINPINLDEQALNLLLAYYGGTAWNIIGQMTVDELMKALTEQQKDDIYRKVWHEHVCEDISSHLEILDEELSEKQISYAADRYVYDGEYDCSEGSYWNNIENVINMAKKDCKPD